MRADKFFNTKNTEPLIIAELSGNHNNSIKIAKKLYLKSLRVVLK